jgi:alkanesulfonate monooxygenase SsuD/methylene tetrahydromethanopterin reductase-like flavin-dependent oxidoreductase (luciferase family)
MRYDGAQAREEVEPMTTFGYCVEAPAEWPELLELARRLDTKSRFDSFWMADALLPNGPPDAPRLDAWTALAAVAQATSRLRLGILVSGNAYRHPALLAKIATTLDHISNGRLTLGIGAGWPGENRRFGIDFWTRAERLARLEESLQVIKALWTQPRPTFQGAYYELDEPPFQPANVQQPHPPILIGGGSEPMLRAIAKYADLASPMIDLAEAKKKVDSYCGELGRNPAEIRWTGGGMLFLHDDPRVQQQAVDFALKTWGGTEESIRAGLFGSAQDVRDAVARQIAAGAGEVIVFQLPRVHMKSLLRFSDEVIPAFQ